MKIIFMGSPDLAAVILRALAGSSHEITGVVTGTDKAKGRKGTPVPTDVGAAAEELGLPVLKTPRVRREDDLAWIREKDADVIVVAAFGQLLPKELLTMKKYGCINVHASLLPAYRGAAPIQWSVLRGEKETGVTIMQMDEGLDTGDILTQRKIALAPGETSGTLFEKMAKEGADLLLATLPLIEANKIEPVKQPEESTTPYAGRITKEMGKIDWSRNAAEIDAWIRGMDPWPSAYTYLDGKMFKIWKASVYRKVTDGIEPGTILFTDPRGMVVSTGKDAILCSEVQMEGKKRMKTSDFLRGYTIREARLG